jgi:DNA-binding transcriptional regulator YdaS (Cro superfamily)
LVRAIEIKGSMTALADAIGTTVQAVAQWKRVPAGRCLEVERETGVSRYHLRPDIFGPPPPELAAA